MESPPLIKYIISRNYWKQFFSSSNNSFLEYSSSIVQQFDLDVFFFSSFLLLFSFSLDRCTSVFLHPSTKITRWNFLKTFNYLSSATLFADSFPIISTCDKTLVQEISGMRSFQPLYFSISLHHKRNFLFTLLFLCV